MESILFGLVGGMPWWGYVIITLILTHITIASVTIYLHRVATHRALKLHKIPEHFFRFWLWLTTGMVTKEWVAVHRSHHANCEGVKDPHSPLQKGLLRILSLGWWEYHKAAKEKEVLAYAEGSGAMGLPNDWIERYIYTKCKWMGVVSSFFVQLFLFGLPGIVIWVVQMVWIPVTAAGVINGIGHYFGYRNAETDDRSTNIFPWGILIGGEELHNNHHAYPTSGKLSLKTWEFDIGWLYIRILSFLGLAFVKEEKIAKLPVEIPIENPLDCEELLKLFKHHRAFISQKFSEHGIKFARLNEENQELFKKFRLWLQPGEEIKSYELDAWVGKVRKMGNQKFMDFANWFRGLHEQNEKVAQNYYR